MAVDISNFPPPPGQSDEADKSDISDFPPPPSDSGPAADISDFPAPPTEKEAKREPFQPPELYPGEHADLKDINAITPRELQMIAERNPGVDWKDLRTIAPYWRVGVQEEPGYAPPITDDMKKFAGYVGSAGMDLPQFIYKKLQNPAMRGAIDDLASLAETRKGSAVRVGEFLSGLAVPFLGGAEEAATAAKLATKLPAAGEALGTIGKSIAKEAAVGTGFGAAGGLAESREGEEVRGTLTGGAFGAVVGGGLGAVVGTLKVGGAVRAALGARTEAEVGQVTRQVEEEMAKADVASEIQRGEGKVVDIAINGEGPSSTIALDNKAVLETEQRLRTDDVHFSDVLEGNPDLYEFMEPGATGAVSEDALYRMAARKELEAKESSDLIQFVGYLKNPNITLPTTEKELVKATTTSTLKEAAEYLREWVQKGRDEEFLRKSYKDFKAIQIAQDLNAEYIARGGGVTSSEFTRLTRMYARVRGYFKLLDNRQGTQLEVVADRFVQSDNLKNKAINQAITEARPTLKASTDSGLRDISVNTLEQIEKTGNLNVLSDAQKTALEGFNSLFKSGLEKARALGVSITEISAEKAKLYIPKMQVDAATTTGRIRDRIAAIEEASGISFKSMFNAEDMKKMQASAPKAFDELVRGLEYLSDEKVTDATSLSRLSSQAITVDGTARLVSSKAARRGPSVALARSEEGIPSFLRETDLNKLYVRWTAEVNKQVYWRNSIQDLTTQRNFLAARGDRAGVEYVDAYLRRLAGGEQGIAKWAKQVKSSMAAGLSAKAQEAERLGNKGSAKFYRAVGDNLDFGGALSGIMYGNLLGLNPKTFVQNLTQPFVTMLPELSLGGNGWAAAKAMKGYFGALQELGNPARMSRTLQERGYMAPAFSDELQGAFRTGIEHGAAGRVTRTVLDKMNTYGLSMLQASETFNRITAMKTAEGIAQDLMMGSNSAKQFMNGIGRGYQYEIEKLVRAGDSVGLTRTLQDYLVAKTMFHYSPLMVSRLGAYLGKIGTAFSTWPTTISADIAADFASKGAVGGGYLLTKKYLAPLAALITLDHWAHANNLGPDQSPRMHALVGKHGFAGLSPLKAVSDISTRGILSSPYLDSAFKQFSAAASGDARGWWRGFKEMGQTFVPGSAYVNLLHTTYPRLFLNQEPPKK